jgi:hypothetical protein
MPITPHPKLQIRKYLKINCYLIQMRMMITLSGPMGTKMKRRKISRKLRGRKPKVGSRRETP